MASRILNGGNRWRTFSVTDSATPTLATTVAYDLVDDIVQTTVERADDTSAYSVTVDNVADTPTLNTYLETFMSVAAATAIPDLTLEDGVKEKAVSSSNQTQIGITRGGLQGNVGGAARKVGVFAVRLKNSSGGWTQQGENYNRVNLSYEGFKLSGGLTVPATYMTSIATTPAIITLTTAFPYGRVAFQ